jgi:diacylglycerol O-acyltransferase
MVERLTTLDTSFLYLDEPGAPLLVAGVLVLEKPPGGLESLAALVSARLPLVPRYRQRVVEVPGHLANPAWVDDPDFELEYHLRRSALPKPGSESQLLDLVSRVTSRPMDRSRPLWEMYLVEGLAGNRVAVVTKTHPVLIDGLSAIDIGQVLLDVTPDAQEAEPDDWRPRPAPGRPALVGQAVAEYLRRPSTVFETARGAITDVRATAARMSTVTGGVLRALRSAAFPAPPSPLNSTSGPQRRVVVARADLDQLKKIRAAHDATVNDVLLTVVSGALREWLLSRGEPVVAGTSVRALVQLPVGEPNPRVRLSRLSYVMRGVVEDGQSVPADTLAALTGFAPSTLHALGVRAARGLSRRLFNLVVTNVPGPQVPLYAAGGRVLEVFPVVPLLRGQALSIGITSYDGQVFFGLNADRDSMGDVDLLADLIEQEVGQLLEDAA